jgi:hypothetical protein
VRLSTGIETGHFTQNRCSGHDRFSIYMIGLHIIRRSKIWVPPWEGVMLTIFGIVGAVIALPTLVVIAVTIVDVVNVRRSR